MANTQSFLYRCLKVVAESQSQQQLDKYKTLIEELLQLGPNDWPKFQDQLKKTAPSSKLSSKTTN